LDRLKEKYFPEEGKVERIANAEKAFKDILEFTHDWERFSDNEEDTFVSKQERGVKMFICNKCEDSGEVTGLNTDGSRVELTCICRDGENNTFDKVNELVEKIE